jgi:hypothetical protein
MAQTPPPQPPKQSDSKPPVLGAVARLYWMLGGNGALTLIAIGIAQRRPDHEWIADAAFWTVMASLILVRYIDIALLGGTTATGDPATFREWRRYTTWLLLLGLVLWVVAHAVRDRLMGTADAG